MKRSVFGASVQGASHKRNGIECQDNFKIRDKNSKVKAKVKNEYLKNISDNITILAVADGHGSSSCPYSRTGSKIAVNVFCEIITEFCYKFRDDMEALEMQLKSESDLIHLAKAIEIDWKKRVRNNYNLNKNKKPPVLSKEEEQDEYAVTKLYGTTLLGMLLTDKFVFSFQLGDGEICVIDKTGVRTMLEREKILGIETHSLSKKSAWKHAVSSLTYFCDYKDEPFMFMVSTDGMINSYVSEQEFYKSCQGYYSMIQEHGADAVKRYLEKWLNETSEQGCGDDIAVVFAYFG